MPALEAQAGAVSSAVERFVYTEDVAGSIPALPTMVCRQRTVVTQHSQPPILVKRYAEVHLYDTAAARNVSLAGLLRWLRQQVAFVVRVARIGEDVTRVLLSKLARRVAALCLDFAGANTYCTRRDLRWRG